MQKITSKELAQNMAVSVRTAERYMADIKKHYNIKTVLKSHIESYFKIDTKTLNS